MNANDLPLLERLEIDVLWHQRRGNETIANDIKEAIEKIRQLTDLQKENINK